MPRTIQLADGLAPAVAAARRALKNPGAVLLVPTETVYGLVCDWFDRAAVERIYELKGRDRDKPFAAFVADYRKMAELGAELAGAPEELARKYCPGRITIIAGGPNGTTLGFRIPDHEFILTLLRQEDRILASTSANAAGRPNALSVEAALNELHGEVDLAIDAGPLPPDAQASTVVLATGNPPIILRQGALKVEL